MGLLEPGPRPLPERAIPTCCNRCESRTVKKHCEGHACSWVICAKCFATSGVIAGFDQGAQAPKPFTGWQRSWFGRAARG